jgi:hypothetical protein
MFILYTFHSVSLFSVESGDALDVSEARYGVLINNKPTKQLLLRLNLFVDFPE